jgi:hypothetical protein
MGDKVPPGGTQPAPRPYTFNLGIAIGHPEGGEPQTYVILVVKHEWGQFFMFLQPEAARVLSGQLTSEADRAEREAVNPTPRSTKLTIPRIELPPGFRPDGERPRG